MSNLNHTPGPWTTGSYNVEAGPDVTYAVHARDTSAHTLRANARLIAAAPDLLHALKWAAEYVSLYTGDGAGWTGVQQGPDRERFWDSNGDLSPEKLRGFLEETIAKATGGDDE